MPLIKTHPTTYAKAVYIEKSDGTNTNLQDYLDNFVISDTDKLIYYGKHETFDKVYRASDSYVNDPGDKGGISIYNEGIVTNSMIDISKYKGIKLKVATTVITCVQLCKSKSSSADNGVGPYHSVTKPTSWGGDTNFSANSLRYIVADSTNKYWEVWVPFSDAILSGSNYYIAVIQWGRVWSHIPEMILI